MFDRLNRGLWWDRALTLVEGCTPVSPGCNNCWSATLANRLRPRGCHGKDMEYHDGFHWTGKIHCREDRLDLPLKTKKPTVWAVWNDLFHEDVPTDFILRFFENIGGADHHIYLILTKRPERALQVLTQIEQILKSQGRVGLKYWHCVWIGVTAENQEQVYKRIPILLQIPAAVRFVSVEPILSYVNLIKYLPHWQCNVCGEVVMPLTDHVSCKCSDYYEEDWELRTGLNWIICGGESGRHARPCHPDWVRSLRDQCQAAGVPYFLKQWGEWHENPQMCYPKTDPAPYLITSKGNNGHNLANSNDGGDIYVYRVGKKAAGRILDGQEWLEVPI